MQLEGLPIETPHILHQQHALQVVLQRPQLKISLTVVVRQNGDAVVQLSCVGVSSIVHQYHFGHVAINYPQVLAVHALGGLVAMLAEQPVVNVAVLGVEVVEDNVGIATVTGSEDDDFEVFA